MAFGNLATHLIIFIAAVSMATGLAVAMKVQVDKTSNGMAQQQERLSDSLRTDVTIEVITHNTTLSRTSVYVKNTGSAKIDISKVDFFTNGLMIPRNILNRTIEVVADTDTVNIGVWDSGEVLLAKINQTLSASSTHTIRITTDNGISDEKDFSI